jgi:phosphonate degradation associated HDIG domain protein
VSNVLQEILDLYQTQGQRQYGNEVISQLDHALQCASLAEQASETAQTIAASLLHDLGHLLAAQRPSKPDHDTDKDDLHQYIALPFLRSHFPDAVLEPIRMHVDAKRYLCLVDSSYWDALSPASKQSLELQGGVFDRAQATAFMALPFALESVRLRRYDDMAKVKDLKAPALSHFKSYLESVMVHQPH